MKKTLTRLFSLLLAAIMLLGTVPALAVGDEEVRIIVVSPKKLTLNEGDKYKLTVSAKDGGALSDLTWESSDSSVITVDNSGNLTAHREGEAKVKVYAADGSTDSSACRVTVRSKGSSGDKKDVRIIVMAPKKLTLSEGDKYRLTVSAKDGGALSGLTWESSDSSVVTVDNSGNLIAHREGEAKVKVYAADGSTDSSACRVTVRSKGSSVDKKDVRIIVMDPKKLTLSEGDKYRLTVSAKDGGALSGLTWESSNSSVITVDNSGNLIAHREGEAKVKVYAADGSTDSSTCRVTVKERAGNSGSSGQDKEVRVIVASPKKLSLMEGDTYKLTVAAKDGGYLSGLIWESDDPEVVRVDSSGSLTALKKGSARIKVYASDGSTDSSTCRVTVDAIKKKPIKAKIEGYIYDANYNRVNSSTEAAVREYCERLGDSRIDKMLRKAVEKVGTPYSTMDCSQMSKYAYSSLGFSLPRVSDDQAEAMIKYKRDSGKPEKGDICFMKFPSVVKCSCGDKCRRYMQVHHAAVYLGQINGRTYVVDSSSAIGNVIIREFYGNTIAGMPVVFYAGK